MPGDPTTNAPATVLTYNGDSARGWNDPPTFAFTANKGNARPKIDLRKRVSHQEALGGSRTPPVTQTLLSHAVNNGTSEALSAMNINGPASAQPPFIPPATISTSPNVYAPVATPSPVYCGPISAIPEAPLMSVPVPAPMVTPSNSAPVAAGPSDCASHIGQPLFSVHNHQYEPVRTADSMPNIRSTAEIKDHFDDGSQGHSETIPQIFHPILSSETSGAQPGYQGNLFPVQPVGPVGRISPAPFVPPTVPFQPQPVGHITPPPPSLNSQTHPMASPLNSQSQPQFPASKVVPSTSGNLVGTVGHITPPPPTSFTPPVVSSNDGSKNTTPRSNSPANQDKDSSDDSGTELDDEEGLKATLDALQDVIHKYQDSLSKRVSDDLHKRLQMMSQRWRDNKLSHTVKRKMVKLAETLDNGNSQEAHEIHVQLMVNYVSEVNQWMVGVKRLISLVSSSSNSANQS